VAGNEYGLLLGWYSVIRQSRTAADKYFPVEDKNKS
jgi:hypothetical protein